MIQGQGMLIDDTRRRRAGLCSSLIALRRSRSILVVWLG
jgi:hypothetical protein